MISLIVPFKGNVDELLVLLSSICDLNLKPQEVIIVNASLSSSLPFSVDEVIDTFESHGMSLIVTHCQNAFPGAARNRGIQLAKGDILAFLDLSTTPSKEWLTQALWQLRPELECVWGRTNYEVDGYFYKLFKYATYGERPLITLPGSLIRRSVFYKVGLFVEWTRAGEDADWMSRFNLHKLEAVPGKIVLTYKKLNQLSFLGLVAKWYRNYFYGSQMPYLQPHKTIYYHSAVLIGLMFSFNWNAMWASWDETNFLYFPHITKITMSILLLFYFVLRGILLPVRKGVSFRELLPFSWVLLGSISLILDAAKILAFTNSRLKLLK